MENPTTQIPQNTPYTCVLPGVKQKEKAFAVFRTDLVQTHEALMYNTFLSHHLSHRAETWQKLLELLKARKVAGCLASLSTSVIAKHTKAKKDEKFGNSPGKFLFLEKNRDEKHLLLSLIKKVTVTSLTGS